MNPSSMNPPRWAGPRPTPGQPMAAGTSNTADATRPRATPVVAKLARQNGVDLATVTGTGVGGRITTRDVRAAKAEATRHAAAMEEARLAVRVGLKPTTDLERQAAAEMGKR